MDQSSQKTAQGRQLLNLAFSHTNTNLLSKSGEDFFTWYITLPITAKNFDKSPCTCYTDSALKKYHIRVFSS
jgi:hypothetical protein